MKCTIYQIKVQMIKLSFYEFKLLVIVFFNCNIELIKLNPEILNRKDKYFLHNLFCIAGFSFFFLAVLLFYSFPLAVPSDIFLWLSIDCCSVLDCFLLTVISHWLLSHSDMSFSSFYVKICCSFCFSLTVPSDFWLHWLFCLILSLFDPKQFFFVAVHTGCCLPLAFLLTCFLFSHLLCFFHFSLAVLSICCALLAVPPSFCIFFTLLS